jgi:hypothetical protein
MGEISLERYKVQERRMSAREAKRGFTIHAVVTVAVVVGLVALNVFVASELPWSIFPAVGMSLGLWFHWYFGVRHGDDVMRQHQGEVEREAGRQAA